MRYKLTIAYDGTRYNGWQIQPNGTTIQGLVRDALKVVIKQTVPVIGSGRTDSGVHALGQVAHFETANSYDLDRLRLSLNGLLPDDIRIKSVSEVSDHFHAQYSATSKTYHYHLYFGKVDDPFTRPYHLKISQPVDLDLLYSAKEYFVGTHDFTSFANDPTGGSVAKDPVRTLKRLDIVPEPGGVRLEFESNGFLYKMVRNITGTLLEVILKKRSIEDIPVIFAAKDRRRAGIAAPAHGLFLVKVEYPEALLKKGTVLPLALEERACPDREYC